jgi:hypothetical protein
MMRRCLLDRRKHQKAGLAECNREHGGIGVIAWPRTQSPGASLAGRVQMGR